MNYHFCADFLNVDDIQNLINFIATSGEYPNHIVHLSANRIKNERFHKMSWQSFEDYINVDFRAIIMIYKKHEAIVSNYS